MTPGCKSLYRNVVAVSISSRLSSILAIAPKSFRREGLRGFSFLIAAGGGGG